MIFDRATYDGFANRNDAFILGSHDRWAKGKGTLPDWPVSSN